VTESLLMRDLNQAIERMRELKDMGVSLSIDDFGTGYSSLSALKSFPISTLKIDKSFVRDLAHSPDDQAIALAVISLGHRLHLRVIAEGVETEEQRDFLAGERLRRDAGLSVQPSGAGRAHHRDAAGAAARAARLCAAGGLGMIDRRHASPACCSAPTPSCAG
jgi:predicted signal transduction protein with EAL and GGDEF domain